MRATTLQARGFRISEKKVAHDTADYIFGRFELHEYEIDNAHFKMKNGLGRMPIVVQQGGDNEMRWIANQMIATADNIITICDQFIDGATIRFPRKETAVKIYQRVLQHMDAHLGAMRTDKMYEAPNADDFRQLAEFALMCRSVGVDVDPDIDQRIVKNQMQGFLPVRAQFSRMDLSDVKKERLVPKSVQRMDIIERFLEERNG